MKRRKKLLSIVPTAEPVCVKVHEAAILLGIPRTGVYKLIESGKLKSIKSGRRRTVSLDAIREYARRAEAGAPPPSPSETRHTRLDGQKKQGVRR